MHKMFYGKPPASIEAWIIENFIPGPVPGPTPTPEPEPILDVPNGKVLYKSEPGGEWQQDDADISDNVFNGFANKENAVEVVIPSKDSNVNSVTSIGDRAFYCCSGLTSMTIPNSVTSIEYGAFAGCTGLKNVTIPDSVKSIGYGAFAGCSNLTNVMIGNSVASIGNYAFRQCSKLTSITIPDSVTSIWSHAFDGCSGLKSMTIPDSIETFGYLVFGGAGVTSVTIVANGGNAENVKLALINTGVNANVEWTMPSTGGHASGAAVK